MLQVVVRPSGFAQSMLLFAVQYKYFRDGRLGRQGAL